MCEFCVQHGDGKKWYLTLKNYSRELLEEEDRVDYMLDFANGFEERTPPGLAKMEAVKQSPLHSLAKPFLVQHYRRMHYGQVLPMEEVEQVLEQVDGIARIACVCRRVTTGQKNARYCYLLTKHERLAAELDDSFNLEYLTTEEAVHAIRKLDVAGLVHSVWTFKTPYIGAICNCDQDCIAYRICHSEEYFKIMFRGEYVAEVVLENCSGCKNCLRQCQFGAMRYSAATNKVHIDPRLCYGCGLCRATCHKDAITLTARELHPVAQEIW